MAHKHIGRVDQGDTGNDLMCSHYRSWLHVADVACISCLVFAISGCFCGGFLFCFFVCLFFFLSGGGGLVAYYLPCHLPFSFKTEHLETAKYFFT